MKRDKNLKERSPRIQEIMGKIPPWVIRWGMSVVFAVLLLLIFVSWVIKYPEKVNFIVKIKDNERLGYYGVGYLKEDDYVKVSSGMKVKIKMKGYSYTEYGVLEGEVKEKRYDEEKGFVIIIRLKKGLETNFKKSIKYYEGMSGDGEIIVKVRRLIEKLINKKFKK